MFTKLSQIFTLAAVAGGLFPFQVGFILIGQG
jgi:hypothetical protein